MQNPTITEITGVPVNVKKDWEAAAEREGIPLVDFLITAANDAIEKTSEKQKRADAWTWALALVKAAGGSPTPDFLALVEREKRGEITTADMKEYLDRKYKVKESG